MVVDVFEAFVTEVNTLNNLLRKRAARLLRNDSLAPAELRVLQILRNEGSKTVPEIGRSRLTSRQNIQITVNRLKKAGMVEYAPNPAHKRSPLVRLTAEGQRVLEHALEKGTLPEGQMGAELAEDDIVKALEFLGKVRNMLEPEARARKQRGRKRAKVSPQPLNTAEAVAGEPEETRPAIQKEPAPGNSNRSPEAANHQEEELPVNLL